jgi:hypothetical protein
VLIFNIMGRACETCSTMRNITVKFAQIAYEISVYIARETYYASATKTDQLILFREQITSYCEDHSKHINMACGHSAEVPYVNAGGKYGDYLASNR